MLTEIKNSNVQIVKSNQLINARGGMTITEQRVFLYALSKLRMDQREFEPIHIHITDLYNKPGKKQYQLVKNAVKVLQNYNFGFQNDAGQWAQVSIFDVEGDDNDHSMTLHFNDRAKPFLLNLVNGNYTKYFMKDAWGFKSSRYSLRIYELCKQYPNVLRRPPITVEDLKGLVGAYRIDEKGKYVFMYPSFSKFDEKVLKPAVAEINELSDIFVKYEKIRKGRTVESIVFISKLKDQVPKVLSAEEPVSKTQEISFEIVQGKSEKEKYIEEQMKGRNIKNPVAYKKKLMGDPSIDEQMKEEAKVKPKTKATYPSSLVTQQRIFDQSQEEKRRQAFSRFTTAQKLLYFEAHKSKIDRYEKDILETLKPYAITQTGKKLIEDFHGKSWTRDLKIKIGAFLIKKLGTKEEKLFLDFKTWDQLEIPLSNDRPSMDLQRELLFELMLSSPNSFISLVKKDGWIVEDILEKYFNI